MANERHTHPQWVFFERWPGNDRRFRRGDDFAGDAWRNTRTGEIVWTAVGVDRNASACAEFKDLWAKRLAEVEAIVLATWPNEAARNDVVPWCQRAARALEQERFQSVEVALAEAVAIGRYYQQPTAVYEDALLQFRAEQPLPQQACHLDEQECDGTDQVSLRP